jgi:hypothetical protein
MTLKTLNVYSFYIESSLKKRVLKRFNINQSSLRSNAFKVSL